MKAQVISFNCTLKDPMGRVISSSFNHGVVTGSSARSRKGPKAVPTPPASTLPQSVIRDFPDFQEPLQSLVEGLSGLKKGEKRHIFVSAEQAYGFYDPELVLEVSRKKLPHGEALEIGYQVVTQSGDGESRIFRVIATDGHSVTLDGNHPLAGQDLFFDVEATSTREATPEEIAQARACSRAPQLH